MRGQRKEPNIQTACNCCRVRKVRCSGGSPCVYCVNHGQDCTYALIHRKRRAQKHYISFPSTQVHPMQSTTQIITPSNSTHGQNDAFMMESGVAQRPEHARNTEPAAPGNPSCDQEKNTLPPQLINNEYHGPASWLSICSEPGLDWVRSKCGMVAFADSAREFISNWTHRLKLRQSMSPTPFPEPDVDTAWYYTQAYFNRSHDIMFGVVHRPSFESQLRTHFQQRNTSERECPSWYALRNIVYALGCRSAALQDWGAGSLLPPVEASNYFENAFSVYADLLYTPAEFASVQALTLLTFYTEGLGNPSLEYMLCATAARLGQAQGLHREPAKAWQLSPSENFHRSCVFWAIYCTEKQISFRSGRPSAIDDDDINCPLPESTVSEGEGDIEVFQSVINHAQLCSSMHKQLSSVQALRQSFENTISTVSHLSSRLEQWRESLPLNLRPGTSINASGIDSKRKPRIIFLHYLYYASLISLNANFSYPWICDAIWTTRSEALREQIARSTEIVAEASRNIILLSHYTEVDLTFPTWVVFYFPILGMINLFISILKSPTSSSVKSDLALLDIGAGYFGHIDFMSASELSISLPKDIATLAAKFAKDMKVEHEANVCQVSTIPQAREKAKSVTENGLFDNDPLRLSEPENIDFNIEHQDISMEVMDILAGGNLNFDWSQS